MGFYWSYTLLLQFLCALAYYDVTGLQKDINQLQDVCSIVTIQPTCKARYRTIWELHTLTVTQDSCYYICGSPG